MKPENGLEINYPRNQLNIEIAGALEIFQNIPRHGHVTVEQDGKWYSARISHREYIAADSEVQLRCDPVSKKGEFASNSSVSIQIEQE